MNQHYKYMVYVSCMTYNHEKYIKDALDGFCMQQTTFPFICCIYDDASTDGESSIIHEYLEEYFDLEDKDVAFSEETADYNLVFAKHKTNKNCYFAVLFLKYNHYQIKKSKVPYTTRWRDNSKYYAVCEGDDYWTDPLKLQKQVDFMESHKDHSLCFHAHTNVFRDKVEEVNRYDGLNEDVPIKDIILGDGGFIASAAMLYKHDLVREVPEWRKKAKTGDYSLALHLATVGKVGYLPDNMCCYRVSTVGSWTHRIAKDDKMFKVWYDGSMDMFDGFDVWTHKKYHRQVRIMKNRMRRDALKRIIHKII